MLGTLWEGWANKEIMALMNYIKVIKENGKQQRQEVTKDPNVRPFDDGHN